MNKTHYLVVWGHFVHWENYVPEMENLELIDADSPQEAIAKYPTQLGLGQPYVVGTVKDAEEHNGEKSLSLLATPMEAYPSWCEWTSANNHGRLNKDYMAAVNDRYQTWLINHKTPVHNTPKPSSKSTSEYETLLDEVEQLRTYKKNTEKSLMKEYQRLYDAGFVKSMLGNHLDGTFSFDLNLDCPLREELAKSNYWKRYYEDKYLALLPDEERNPPPQAPEA